MRRMLTALIALAVATGSATGQSSTRTVDPEIARAQQRAASGDSAAARAILDSLMTPTLDLATRGEVAYWKTRFAATAIDRQRGLAMVIVDYPFSTRAGAAQYELGMLESAHSDRDRAAVHLAGFLAANPSDSNRSAASLALGRILLDRGDAPRACAVLLAGRAELPATAIEIRNQFDFSASSCRGVDTSVVAVVAAPDTTAVKSMIGEYTVQVAAFDLRNQADRLATRLRGQGLEARVIGSKKPFRVRVGHYLTHAQADAASRKIEALTRTKPFVTLVGPGEK